MTLYISSTHPDHRPVGAHRKPSPWDHFLDWLSSPHARKAQR